jgi:hypothetical protein
LKFNAEYSLDFNESVNKNSLNNRVNLVDTNKKSFLINLFNQIKSQKNQNERQLRWKFVLLRNQTIWMKLTSVT